MAKNLINFVETVQDRVRSGWNGGVDERSVKDIPLLLKRIQELETALVPFARRALLETKYNSTKELVDVYRKDCQRAFEMITVANGKPLPYEDFGIPA